MNAAQFLDSKSRDEILKRFIATYRNKRKKPGELEAALQAVFDAAGLTMAKVEQPISVPRGTPEPVPQTDAPAMKSLDEATIEERKHIFGLEDDPPIPNPTPEQKAQAQAEARLGQLNRLKPLLPNIGLGRKASIVIPDDFPVHDLPGYLAEIGGYGVTDKVPVNIATTWKVASKQAELDGRVFNGPKSGWMVELIKVG